MVNKTFEPHPDNAGEKIKIKEVFQFAGDVFFVVCSTFVYLMMS